MINEPYFSYLQVQRQTVDGAAGMNGAAVTAITTLEQEHGLELDPAPIPPHLVVEALVPETHLKTETASISVIIFSQNRVFRRDFGPNF